MEHTLTLRPKARPHVVGSQVTHVTLEGKHVQCEVVEVKTLDDGSQIVKLKELE